MELFGILFGAIFWTIVITAWFSLCRHLRLHKSAFIVGSAFVLGMPTLLTLWVGYYCFVQEPILNAAAEGDVPQLRRLVTLGARVNEPSNEGMTALNFAVANRKTEAVHFLIEHGADVNHEATSDNRTPLAEAKYLGSKEIVALLEKAGAEE